MAYNTENLYWFLKHTSPSFTTRSGSPSGIDSDSDIDTHVQGENAIRIVNTSTTMMWDADGKRVYPSANSDYDLLLKFTLSQYVADAICPANFAYVVNALIANFGLKNFNGDSMTIQEVWVNPNKQVDRMKVLNNTTSTTMYYDTSGHCIDSGSSISDTLCLKIAASEYGDLYTLTNGTSSYINGTYSASKLHPELALSGATVDIDYWYVDIQNNLFKYSGTYSSTSYEWAASGKNITVSDESLNLTNQILYTTYIS